MTTCTLLFSTHLHLLAHSLELGCITKEGLVLGLGAGQRLAAAALQGPASALGRQYEKVWTCFLEARTTPSSPSNKGCALRMNSHTARSAVLDQALHPAFISAMSQSVPQQFSLDEADAAADLR